LGGSDAKRGDGLACLRLLVEKGKCVRKKKNAFFLGASKFQKVARRAKRAVAAETNHEGGGANFPRKGLRGSQGVLDLTKGGPD